MSRSVISNPKKLRRLAELVKAPVVKAFARGGTDHRIDICLADGRIVSLFKDGTMEVSEYRWSQT